MWELIHRGKKFAVWRRRPLVREGNELYEWTIGGYWQGIPVEPNGAVIFPNRKAAEAFGNFVANLQK